MLKGFARKESILLAPFESVNVNRFGFGVSIDHRLGSHLGHTGGLRRQPAGGSGLRLRHVPHGTPPPLHDHRHHLQRRRVRPVRIFS